jgi:ribonuclease P protein component
MKGKRQDMTTLHKLKKNYEFKKVYNEEKYYVEKYVVMYIVLNNSNFNRVGFSVSKKVGKSVVRNKVKRQMKEAYRKFADNTKLGFDIVFTARAGSGSADYKMIENNIKSVLKRAKLKKCEE